MCSGDNRTVANASHSCSPGSSATWVQFTESTQLSVEFFVVKDHLRDGVFFLLDVDQALTTDKGQRMQRAWHGTGMQH